MRVAAHRYVLGLMYIVSLSAIAIIAIQRVRTLFNSQPVEIKDNTVVMKVGDETRELENDFVFVFAGGVPPFDFLPRAGIRMGGDQEAPKQVAVAS